MAAASVSAPGSKFGPCLVVCDHVDCGQSRQMAAGVCRLCGVAIGYETRFFTDPHARDGLVHAVCLEDEIAKRKAAAR